MSTTHRRATTLAIPILVLISACSSAGGGAAVTPNVEDGGRGGGYGGGGGYDDSDKASAPAPAPAAEAASIDTGTAAAGTFLTGASGMTLYIFKNDTAGKSTCDGDCAAKWPPLVASSGTAPAAGDGVTGTLTTFARSDGSMQVAYDGQPLYYFANDAAPGDTNGHGVGEVWFIAEP